MKIIEKERLILKSLTYEQLLKYVLSDKSQLESKKDIERYKAIRKFKNRFLESNFLIVTNRICENKCFSVQI